ncbi:MAG: SDR family NAD(P)-dependent oxidoreductase [Hyphomicrobiaceae bacterium]
MTLSANDAWDGRGDEIGAELRSFDEPVRALIVAAAGGIGGALVRSLLAMRSVEVVHAWSRKPPELHHPKLQPRPVDITVESEIAAAAAHLCSVNLIVIASGVLHRGNALQPEKTIRQLDPERLAEIFQVNVIGPALVAKHTVAHLPKRRRGILAAISARVGSITDNRLGGWYGYRSSKAALNQFIRTLSIEIARTHPAAICLGLHPGSVDTALSFPFRERVPQDRLFSPSSSAQHLLRTIDESGTDQSGRVLAWDGSEVPP